MSREDTIRKSAELALYTDSGDLTHPAAQDIIYLCNTLARTKEELGECRGKLNAMQNKEPYSDDELRELREKAEQVFASDEALALDDIWYAHTVLRFCATLEAHNA